MATSQRGKKFNDDIKEQAFALLATNNNAKYVADTLGLKYTTVKTWEKKFLEQAEKQRKAKEQSNEQNQEVTNSEAKNLVELRNKKKQEFINESWEIISNTQKLIKRRIARALESEDKLDELVNEATKLDGDEALTNEQRKEIYRKLSVIKVEDIGKLTTALGTLYDKQALANNESTSNVSGTVRIEEIIKKAEGESDF